MLARQRVNFKIEEDIARIRAQQEEEKKAYLQYKREESQK